MDAELAIGFRAFTERYTSRVTLKEPNEVTAKAIESRIFSELRSTWKFSPGHDARSTRVDFEVEFAVHNPLAAVAVSSFFADVAKQQVTAFERRCKQLFPEEPAPAKGADETEPASKPPSSCASAASSGASAAAEGGSSKALAASGHPKAGEAAAEVQGLPERRERSERALPFAVGNAVAVLGELRRVRAVLLEHATTTHGEAAADAAPVAVAGGKLSQALPRVLTMEDFKAACRVLGEMFDGFKLLAEDPALAAALYSSIKYMLRRRARGVGRRAVAATAAAAGSSAASAAAGAEASAEEESDDADEAAVSEAAAAADLMQQRVGFSDRGLLLVGHALDDFCVSAYMMVQAGPDDRARFVFHAMDTDGNERLDRDELRHALQAYMRSVGRVIPKLLAHQLQHDATGQLSEEDKARVLRRSTAVVDQLMAEIMTEIPSAVEQIFREARLDASGAISQGSWESAWSSFPELLDMMSLRGLSKIVHWVAVLSEDAAVLLGDAAVAAAVVPPNAQEVDSSGASGAATPPFAAAGSA